MLITAVRYDVKPHSPSDTNLKRTIPGVRGKSAELPLISSRTFLTTQRTVFYSSHYTRSSTDFYTHSKHRCGCVLLKIF